MVDLSDRDVDYYDLYNSIYNEKDLKYVTNPFKQDDGFPCNSTRIITSFKPVDQLGWGRNQRPFPFNFNVS